MQVRHEAVEGSTKDYKGTGSFGFRKVVSFFPFDASEIIQGVHKQTPFPVNEETIQNLIELKASSRRSEVSTFCETYQEDRTCRDQNY